MGCKYCGMNNEDHNGNIGIANKIKIKNIDILLDIWGDGVDIALFQDGVDIGEHVITINFCPMCGCRL